jgi:hypothetical protein
MLPDLYARKALGLCDRDECETKHVPYPPEALGAFIGVICLAASQEPLGRFPSRKVLVALLEGDSDTGAAYARQVDFLIEQGDLIPMRGGGLYVDGWDELQGGDWDVATRMRRYRSRKNPQPIEDSADDPAVTYERVTGRFPTDKAIKWIDDLSERYGADATHRAIAEAARDGEPNGLLGRAADALRREARHLDLAEREQEKQRIAEKRAVNTPLIVAYHNGGRHVGAPDSRCPYCQEVAS